MRSPVTAIVGVAAGLAIGGLLWLRRAPSSPPAVAAPRADLEQPSTRPDAHDGARSGEVPDRVALRDPSEAARSGANEPSPDAPPPPSVEDGGPPAEGLDFALRYQEHSLTQLEHALGVIDDATQLAESRLVDEHFATGRFEAHQVEVTSLEQFEENLRQEARSSGDVLHTRRVLPAHVPGDPPATQVEIDIVRLGRKDAPELFATRDEAEWLRRTIELMRGEDDE